MRGIVLINLKWLCYWSNSNELCNPTQFNLILVVELLKLGIFLNIYKQNWLDRAGTTTAVETCNGDERHVAGRVVASLFIFAASTATKMTGYGGRETSRGRRERKGGSQRKNLGYICFLN